MDYMIKNIKEDFVLTLFTEAKNLRFRFTLLIERCKKLLDLNLVMGYYQLNFNHHQIIIIHANDR